MVHDWVLELMAQSLDDVDIYAMEINCGEVVTGNGSLCKIKASKWSYCKALREGLGRAFRKFVLRQGWAFFLWFVPLGKSLTTDNLRKQGITMMDW